MTLELRKGVNYLIYIEGKGRGKKDMRCITQRASLFMVLL